MGSEMCIRDRWYIEASHKRSSKKAPLLSDGSAPLVLEGSISLFYMYKTLKMTKNLLVGSTVLIHASGPTKRPINGVLGVKM